MLLLDQLRFKILAVFLVLALVMPMVMMPVGAVQAQEKVLLEENVEVLPVEMQEVVELISDLETVVGTNEEIKIIN
ncbi:MAG: hypothetical protein LRZ99_07120 [Desulfotomaculum sp.]|nr:hypothetical protein [Desulfotomaculum sp.]